MKSFKITRIFLIIVILSSYFIMPSLTNAVVEYYGKVIATDGLYVRDEPNLYSSSIGELAYNVQVKLVTGSPVSTSGCSGGWYQIEFNGNTNAYTCGTYLSISSKVDSSDIADDEYSKYLESLGFPSTYWPYLSELHKKHPTWEFEAINTNLDWSTSVAEESIVGVSLIQTSYDGWKSTAAGSYDPSTGEFIVQEGSNWYAASSGVVAYYMDPRNFLDEKHVFMFEKLSYDSSYQTQDAVKAVFNGGSMGNYASTFMSAGSTYSINPIYLASRVRQEVGSNIGDSKATTGESFTYEGKTYSGLYNVYNIGATTGTSPVLKGLIWANGGSDGTGTSYNRPWRSIESSIIGGANYIASSYINKGQYTPYFQKFNVAPNSSNTIYKHQYMTNIKAVASESLSTYSSYEEMGLLDTSFKFAIPIYNNMPEYTELPDISFNPDSDSDSNQDPVVIDPNTLINTVGLKTDGTYISGIYEGMEVDLLVTSLKNNGASVSTIAHGNLATGDQFTINGRVYTVILYGDMNADAQISLSDLVQLKKYILGYNNLDSNDKKAADVNKDGNISLSDLVLMKKKMLNLAQIEQ